MQAAATTELSLLLGLRSAETQERLDTLDAALARNDPGAVELCLKGPEWCEKVVAGWRS